MIAQNKNFPVWGLAQEVVTELPRAAIPFFKLFWLPILLNLIAVSIARAIWFEHFDMRANSMPLWIESIISAPFGAVLTIAAFRYFDRGILPKWRNGFQFGYAFYLVVVLVLAFDLVIDYAYGGNWQNWVLQAWLGNAYPTPSIYRIGTLVMFATTIALTIVCALVSIITMGPVWTIVTKNRIDTTWLCRLLRLVPFSVCAYFLLFEIVCYHTGTLYLQLLHWLDVPLQMGTGATNWREFVKLQMMVDVKNLPYNYIVSLIWYAAVAKGLSTAWNMFSNDAAKPP